MRGNKTPKRTVTNFCIDVDAHDVVTSANFMTIACGLAVGFGRGGKGQILSFSIDLRRRPYNSV